MANCLGVKAPTYKAGENMSKLAWLGSEIVSLFTRKEVYITRDVATTACRNYQYSSRKLIETLDYTFIPLSKTIEDTCRAYKIWEKKNR